MTAKLTIFNMALGWLGTRTVASETEQTSEAIQCQLFWDSARRQVLRDYPWSFARRRCRPAPVLLPDGWGTDYAHAFALPADCIKVLGVRNSNGSGEGGRKNIYHTLAYSPESQRQVLLCNCQAPLLVYTADMVDVSLGDDLFAHLLARKIAALMAAPLLRNNASKVKEMEELYRMAIPNAVEADASEGQELPMPDSWLAARYGHGGAPC